MNKQEYEDIDIDIYKENLIRKRTALINAFF